MITNKNGIFGELYANRFLRDNGYDIIRANYRARHGEIDIIAWDNGNVKKDARTMVFVEVKALSDVSLGLPREKVNSEKQKHIISASKTFIVSNKIDCPIRFDVIEVYLSKGEIPDALNIIHLKDAF